MRTKIIYEDNQILIIHKPAGLATQSARIGQADVLSELRNYLHTPDVYIVHRLDQPVEGLLAVAKDKKSAAALSKQLGQGTLNKHYYALVSVESNQAKDTLTDGTNDSNRNEQKTSSTTLTDYLRKNPKTSKAEITSAGDGQKAVLHYQVMNAEIQVDNMPIPAEEAIKLLDVEIETGRFHQIRAQLSHHGMPLLGDQKYGTDTSKEKSERLGIANVALIAYHISLRHPKTGKEMSFSIPCPY